MTAEDHDDPAPPRAAERVVVDPLDAEGMAAALAASGERLRAGELVAFPTETVYGLGANALDAAAVQRVFVAKGRPSSNPLIVHVEGAARVREVAREFSEAAMRLAALFWPGPLTIVLPRRAEVPDVVTGGLDTVGVRVPAHPVARALIAAAGVPLAAPSANPFTKVSPTTAQHVLEQLGDRVDAVVDGGPTTVGIESTVVALEPDGAGGERLVLLRHGGVSKEALQQAGFVVDEPRDDEDDGAARRSPGRIERHYAPGVPLLAVTRGADGALELPATARPYAVLARGDGVGCGQAATCEVLPTDLQGFTRGLYAALHRVAASGSVVAYVERLPDDPSWRAVADRLRRAGLEG